MNEKKAAEARVTELIAEIEAANRKYYEEDAPTISDAAYDALFRELEGLEAKFPELVRKDSPTQRVGSLRSSAGTFSPVAHRVPMLSLANALTFEEFEEFNARAEKLLEASPGDIELLVEHKLDGLAVELVYDGGKFVLGSTRGDGQVGEDVTANLRTVAGVPAKISSRRIPQELEVRGEVVFPVAGFLRLNEERIAKGEAPFANPRNAAAGSVRQLDSAVTASRPLEFVAYGALSTEGPLGDRQAEVLELLRSWGFYVQEDYLKTSSLESVRKHFNDLEERRDALRYEIDGLVIKVDRFDFQERLGVRSRSPRWAVALKFAPREEFTRLLGISVQVGRTGTLTPVAELEPVKIGGVVVRRATLHNEQEIQRKDIRIGDTVVVRRQGDVIPAVVSVVTEKRDGSEKLFYMPTACPVCGGGVAKDGDDGVALRCINPSCPAKVIQRLRHFVSRAAFDIDSFGEKLIEQLVEIGRLAGPADIFTLELEEVANLERMGKKSAQNLITAIEASKQVSLARFIYGLGIRHVGERTAQALAAAAESLDGFLGFERESLLEVEDVGPKVAEAILEFLGDPQERRMIQRLRELGVVAQPVEKKTTQGVFSGETVVFTGTLVRLGRDEAQEVVQSLGGKTSGSVGKGTTLVVAGEKAGSKLKKAEQLGIPVIDEDAFLEKAGLENR